VALKCLSTVMPRLLMSEVPQNLYSTPSLLFTFFLKFAYQIINIIMTTFLEGINKSSFSSFFTY
jgi:hypothetical protein